MSPDSASQSLSLRCARFDTHIKCIEAEEFPPGPKPDDGDRLEVALDELASAVEQTQMAASTDEARPVLTGVLVQVQGGNLTLAATDGHRLAVRKLAASGAPTGKRESHPRPRMRSRSSARAGSSSMPSPSQRYALFSYIF